MAIKFVSPVVIPELDQAVADALGSTPKVTDIANAVVVPVAKTWKITGSGASVTQDVTDPNQVNFVVTGGATDLGVTLAASQITITSSSGVDVVIPAATGGAAGVMSSADKAKMDAIPGTGSNVVTFPVTINHVGGTPDQYVFALTQGLAGLDSAHGFWTAVQADGGDIRIFDDAAKTVRLPIHIAALDKVAKTCLIYVKMQGAKAQSTTFTVQAGSDSGVLSQPAANAAFGRDAVWTGYDLVTANFTDNASGGTGLTRLGVTPPADLAAGVGPAGLLPGVAFLGGDQRIRTSAAIARRDAQTILAFIRPQNANPGPICHQDGDMDELVSTTFARARSHFATQIAFYNKGASFALNTWRHYARRHDRAAAPNLPSFFENGANQGTGTIATAGAGARVNSSDVFALGTGNHVAASGGGIFDLADFRVFNGILSDAYIAATSANILSASSFATAGASTGGGGVDVARASRTITGGGLVTGGGDLSANRVLTVTPSSQAEAEAGADNTTAMTPLRVAQAIAVQLGAVDAFQYKGAIDCSANPNYPAASAGWTYKISVAGKIGGGSGPNVEVNDIIICTLDGSLAGTHAAVGANWTPIQGNLDGAVIGPASATNENPAVFDQATGKLIKQLTYAQFKTNLVLVKADVGLGNVDNTTDAGKPVSTATQAALDLKAPLASPALTGTPTAPTPAAGDNDTSIATTAFVQAEFADAQRIIMMQMFG